MPEEVQPEQEGESAAVLANLCGRCREAEQQTRDAADQLKELERRVVQLAAWHRAMTAAEPKASPLLAALLVEALWVLAAFALMRLPRRLLPADAPESAQWVLWAILFFACPVLLRRIIRYALESAAALWARCGADSP